MAIAFVASAMAQSTNANDVTVTIDSTGANLLVVSLSIWQGRSAYSFSDSKGNTWTALTEYGAINPQTKQWYCLNPSSVGASHSFTITGTGGGAPSLAVHAFSGVGAFDSEGGNNANATSVATASLTPGADGAAFVAVLSYPSTSGSEAGAGTYSGFANLNVTGNAMGIATSYYIQTTAAAASETFTGNSQQRQTSHCCFTPSVAAGQPASRRMGGVKFSRNQFLGMNRW